ncbi:MAG: VOC family protein [Rhodoferax sp.]|nr:VOC family protein [Rhodoferax sp.]
MLDHMTFRVSDIAASKVFYTAALAPLGYTLLVEANYGSNLLGYGTLDANNPSGHKIDTWFIDGASPYGGHATTTGCHLCWSAPSRDAVDAFYAAALAHGGRDNGAPGLRPHYHPHYYGAFVIDLDGNNIEAVCHAPT